MNMIGIGDAVVDELNTIGVQFVRVFSVLKGKKKMRNYLRTCGKKQIGLHELRNTINSWPLNQ